MVVLHSTVEGVGEPVLLVHGLAHRGRVWGPLSGYLTQAGYQVIAVDLPGHGSSPAPRNPGAYSIDATVASIVDTMVWRGVERPHVVGNSLGGLIALELAARGHARSVTALAPAGFSPATHLVRAGYALLRHRVDFARTLGGDGARPTSRRVGSDASGGRAGSGRGETLARLRALHSWAGFAGFLIPAFIARFRGTLTVPATVVWGDRDLILDVRGLRHACRRRPDITWIELSDCGHFPMTQATERVAGIVLDTMRRAG